MSLFENPTGRKVIQTERAGPSPTQATHHSDSPESPPTPPRDSAFLVFTAVSERGHRSRRFQHIDPTFKAFEFIFPKMSKSCLRLRRKTPIIRKKKGGTKRRRSLGALSLHLSLSFSLFIFLSYLRALLSCEQIHSHPIGCARIAFDRAIKRA